MRLRERLRERERSNEARDKEEFFFCVFHASTATEDDEDDFYVKFELQK